jgi:hypothetical protein
MRGKHGSAVLCRHSLGEAGFSFDERGSEFLDGFVAVSSPLTLRTRRGSASPVVAARICAYSDRTIETLGVCPRDVVDALERCVAAGRGWGRSDRKQEEPILTTAPERGTCPDERSCSLISSSHGGQCRGRRM